MIHALWMIEKREDPAHNSKVGPIAHNHASWMIKKTLRISFDPTAVPFIEGV